MSLLRVSESWMIAQGAQSVGGRQVAAPTANPPRGSQAESVPGLKHQTALVVLATCRAAPLLELRPGGLKSRCLH